MTHQTHEPSLLLGHTVSGTPIILRQTLFTSHKVLSGITGSGKSTLLAWIALSLLRQGVAFTLIDPHGDLCRLILQLLLTTDFFSSPKSFEKLWFVDFNRADSAIPFNVLSTPGMDSHSISNGVLEAIHRAFPTVGTTAALDNTFLAATYVLAENHRPITDMQKLLLDASFRAKMLKNVTDPLVVQFFESKLAEKVNSNLIDSSMRRSFLLTFSPQLRNTLSQQENKINFSNLMARSVSCLLSLGGLDDQSKRLLGCFLMVTLEQAFLSRATLPPQSRSPYHAIVDEFPLFSASGDSFSVVLEQCRKYGGTLYLAHQTQHQLSKSVAGSLQNAIPIVLKAGTDDSSALAGRFYRPQPEEQASLFSFTSAPPSLFSGVSNTTEARMIFENLQRQQAIITLNGKPELITTPTLPIGNIDQKKMTDLENAYARHLLTTVQDRGKEQTSPKLYLVPASPALQRRTHTPAQKRCKPFDFLTGDLEQDIFTSLTHFHYLTLDQLTILLRKKDGNKNYLRKKLNTFIGNKLALTQLPRISGGKPLQVYYLAAVDERKHTFLEHTLDCNEVLIAGLQLQNIEPSLTLVDLKHERTLKTDFPQVPCIPDGLLSYQTQAGEMIHIALEIDRNTENRERIIQKYKGYTTLITRLGVDSLTVAFIITAGETKTKRVNALMEMAEDTIGDTDLKPLLLFAPLASDTLTPSVFVDMIFNGLDNTPHALIEKPF